ncbi:hypothetical protein GGR42_002212 [Saonia flava]|uniref:Uncharacterized protein n=1 Tax=Saonia flava TaxID=523696 RepID=A0A846QXS6_9FLAO|nr:DUF1349 domain-containing protein [Saonia flava]NJB71750.1 hypothetical protein [Saonia flava]
MKNIFDHLICILSFLIVLSCSQDTIEPISNDENSSNEEQIDETNNEEIEEEEEEEEVSENEEEETSENEIEINGTVWSLFNKEVFSVEPTNNGLALDLEQNAIWYHSAQGGLLYQTITGDFTFIAAVNVRRKSNQMLAPNCEVCLGGLMARNPNDTNSENYVHVVAGNTPETVNDGMDEVGVEHKSTTNGNSSYEAIPESSSNHELRMVRSGSTFSLYSRDINASDWNLVITYERPDLPNTLQVGFNIYTAISSSSSTADLRVICENISLEMN